MKTTMTKMLCSGGVLLALMQALQPALAADNGVKYRIAWDATDSRYHVFLQPSTTPTPNESYNGAQVTLRVPHVAGAQRFRILDTGVKSLTGTTWSLGMEAVAAESDGNCGVTQCQTDNLDYDYFSFVMDIRNLKAFAFAAGTEVEAFSFSSEQGCRTGLEVMPDNDPFNSPNNSIGTNAGNFFLNRGWAVNPNDLNWTSKENHYLGSYGGAVNCTDNPDGGADTDQDGLSDAQEKTLGTNPDAADTDGDGKQDAAEVGTDTSKPMDTDGDGKLDALESSQTDADSDGVIDERDADDTNPNNDSDGDGYGNTDEKNAGTDPLDKNSKPTTPPVQHVSVPTLGEWAQILLILLMVGVAAWRFPRQLH